MGVKIRNRGSKWYVFVNYRGHRKSKCVGSREAAEHVRRQLEAKLVLGDLSVLDTRDDERLTFDTYADGWLKDYARIECKTSTADGYEGVLKEYLRPRFGRKLLSEIRRDDVKELINDLISKELSRNTIRNALCVIRGLFNYAIEEGLIESNPAARLGRFTRSAKTAGTKGVAYYQGSSAVPKGRAGAQSVLPPHIADGSPCRTSARRTRGTPVGRRTAWWG
jgi:hypothetical protein